MFLFLLKTFAFIIKDVFGTRELVTSEYFCSETAKLTKKIKIKIKKKSV